MSYDLDKSVERKAKRRIVEDMSSDNSGSEDKTHHSWNKKWVRNIFIACAHRYFIVFHSSKGFVPLL